MEIEHILGLRRFSIQGLACGLVPELHSQTKIELDSFINNLHVLFSRIMHAHCKEMWHSFSHRAVEKRLLQIDTVMIEFI